MEKTDPHRDLGATHVALPVRHLDTSVAFYAKYARMQVVHRRADATNGTQVAWISDLTRPFVVVLIEQPDLGGACLGGLFGHLGIGVESRSEVDRLCELAKTEGTMTVGPMDYGYPVGYWAYIVDPDGHNLEISFGQEVGFTVQAKAASTPT